MTTRGPALVSQMASREKEICMNLGNGKLISADGAKAIMKELKALYAPDAPDAVNQDVAKFSRYCKTAETIDATFYDWKPKITWVVVVLFLMRSLPSLVWKAPC